MGLSNTNRINTHDYRHYVWISFTNDDRILCRFNFTLSGRMMFVDAIDKLPGVVVEEMHNIGSYNSYVILSKKEFNDQSGKLLAESISLLISKHIKSSDENDKERKIIGCFRMTREEMQAYLSFIHERKIPLDLRAVPSWFDDNELVVDFLGPSDIDSWAFVEYFSKNVLFKHSL